MIGWEEIGETWQKKFLTDGLSELTVIVGQGEGFVNGLAFKERAPGGSLQEDRPGTRLEDWMDSLSPDALIEILAKRDKHFAELSEATS